MPRKQNNSKILKEFPAIQKLLSEINVSKSNRIYATIAKKHGEVRYLEYFLEKHERIKNADSLIKSIIDYSKPEKPEQNWNALMVELGAFYLLANRFGLNVTAYERKLDSKPPDFVVAMGSNEVSFEVKYRAAMAIQTQQQRTDAVVKEVVNLYDKKYRIRLCGIQNNLGHSMRPNVQKLWSKLSDNNLSEIKKRLKEHIATLERSQVLQKQNRTQSGTSVKLHIDDEDITLHFLTIIAGAQDNFREYHYIPWPDVTEDIKCWIFGDENDEKKTSMIKQAVIKKADYLMCCAPFRKPFRNNILKLFSDYQVSISDKYYVTSADKTLRRLCGIIFFSYYGPLDDEYTIVKNSNKDQKIEGWNSK